MAVMKFMNTTTIQKAFDYLEYKGEDFKNTISLCDTVLSLPMHPYLKDQQPIFPLSQH